MDEAERLLQKAKKSLDAIATATAQYQQDLRAARDAGASRERQFEVLGRSFEQLRQDAMSEEERAAVRAADAERKRTTRSLAKASGITDATIERWKGGPGPSKSPLD